MRVPGRDWSGEVQRRHEGAGRLPVPAGRRVGVLGGEERHHVDGVHRVAGDARRRGFPRGKVHERGDPDDRVRRVRDRGPAEAAHHQDALREEVDPHDQRGL